jgi:hypothetical protein
VTGAPQQVSPPHASTHIQRVIAATTNVREGALLTTEGRCSPDDREHEAEETLIERRLDCIGRDC